MSGGGWPLTKALPLPVREKLGGRFAEEVGQVLLDQWLTCTFSGGLEAQAAPGAHLGLASSSLGWAAGLLGRAGYSPRLLGPTWLGELCKEGRICQRVTSQLPAGHHLGCTELESRAANGCLLYPVGLTSPAHSPGKVSGCQETEHPRGTSCLVPEGPI